MPKQWKLITLYIVFIYCVLVGIIEYTKRHLPDTPPPAAPEQNRLDSAHKAQ